MGTLVTITNTPMCVDLSRGGKSSYIMRKPHFFLLLLVALTLLTEAALQIRLFAQSRQGLIAIAQGKTKYINQQDGLKTLNPLYEKQGFIVNDFGIRSQPYTTKDAPIIFMGASTVMGEFAETNESRFSEIYARITGQTGSHVNAGIAGYRIEDQILMLHRLTNHFGAAKRIVIYPGFNDISDLCSGETSKKSSTKRAPAISLPDWTLTDKKIAGAFSGWPATRKRPRSVDTKAFFEGYSDSAREYLRAASQASREVVVIIPARSFTKGMPPEKKQRLASSMLLFSPCLNVDQLADAIDNANAIMKTEAKAAGAKIIDGDRAMTGIAPYFVDATHFTIAGEQHMAHLLATEIPK